jgi:hypothetical protein
MLAADGAASSDKTTRIIAAAMTNIPDERTIAITIFFLRGIFNCQSIGIGTIRMAASVKMLGMATARKFCGLKAHFHGGMGVTCQFIWVLRRD